VAQHSPRAILVKRPASEDLGAEASLSKILRPIVPSVPLVLSLPTHISMFAAETCPNGRESSLPQDDDVKVDET
jgi:hypothetical protein